MNLSAKRHLENFIGATNYDGLQKSLICFLQEKTEQFSEMPEDYSNRFRDDNFNEVQKVGELSLTPSYAEEGDSTEKFIVVTLHTTGGLTERSSKKRQFDKGKQILKTLYQTGNFDLIGGFFIFYDDDFNYRWSLIYQEPAGRRLQYNPYKRYTYFVSRNLTNKTFIQQLCADESFDRLNDIKSAFSVEKVTREFYNKVAQWYFWVLSDEKIKYPPSVPNQNNGRELFLIRLLSRLIFIWFMKEKKLIPGKLFDRQELRSYLHDIEDDGTAYYNAILQNLFFATLNTPQDRRQFRNDKQYQGKNNDYMNHNKYRYKELFKNETDIEELFQPIPFLNGGLFECLDKSRKDPKNPTEGELRLDGFSSSHQKHPNIRNIFFFGEEQTVDISKYFGDNSYKSAKVYGIIEILKDYNFTIDENVPGDEEVALDPELLGKIFENLLASYNEETSTTARKASGSYYTPREIVEFMCRASLVEYLKLCLIKKGSAVDVNEKSLDEKLHQLLDPHQEELPVFSETEKDTLIHAINNLKVLDPAVGSGAFLMGMLQQLVHILSKLDPHNEMWKQQQIEGVKKSVSDPQLRNELINKIEEQFQKNELDYGRKLYLIQNCLFGVDIQPIAIQLAKLRFFIALLVDEKVDKTQKNSGIEPLPNLETKLVPADTLRSLNIKTEDLSSPEIQEEERKLFELRKKYFSESDQRKKETIKEEDKKTRNRIEELLKQDSLYNDKLETILAWDPYDAHISADWFDAEWMFGIDTGFDIVIANPPYIQLQKEGGKLAKLYEKQNYQTFARTGDIYALFYEKGIQLLRDGGHLCFITSNKWMRAGYGEKLRSFFTQYNPLLLIDLGPGVFENATVDTNILLIQKKQTPAKHLKAVTLQKQNDTVNIEQQVQERA
ncbi:MAG: Eco57I restriction-modification methylase domain-containing protein, partial [Candidatus Hydrogenedens sp.]